MRLTSGRLSISVFETVSPRVEFPKFTSGTSLVTVIVSAAVPVSSTNTEPYYRARIVIDRVDLHGTPPDFHLLPGMPITADIKVGKRTVIQYLLGRVLPVASEGMREP